MQKKLIAAAVAALVSTGALAQVETYGRLDFGYASTETESFDKNGNKVKKDATDTALQSALTTSRLGWNVKEDLGSGLSAFGNLELGINSLTSAGADSGAAGDPFNTRTAYVGLKSDAAGSLSIGRQTVLVDSVQGVGSVGGLNNFIGTAYGSGGANVSWGQDAAAINNTTGLITPRANHADATLSLTGAKLNNTRSANLMQYSSPNFGGVSFAVQYGQSSVETTTGTGAPSTGEMTELGLMVKYAAGPLTVAVGMSDEELKAANAVTSEPSQMALAASYDLGVAKIYALYMDGDDKKKDLKTTFGDTDTIFLKGRDTLEIGANFPLGAVNLFASFFTGESEYDVNIGGTADVFKLDHSGYQLGAKYSLSKRTTAYAMYGSAEAEDTLDPTANIESSGIVLGVAHTF